MFPTPSTEQLVSRTIGLVAAALLTAAASPASAQSGPSGEPTPRQGGADRTSTDSEPVAADEYFENEHRERLYEKSKLHYSEAVLWTALFPPLGNFYAEQYVIGGLHATLMAFTAMFVPYGLLTEQPGFAWAGATIAGTTYLSGFVTSAFGVGAYNRRLRRGLRVTDDSASASGPPDSQNFAPGILLQFRF